jgi:hypothetical protein
MPPKRKESSARAAIRGHRMHFYAWVNLPSREHRQQFIDEANVKFISLIALLLRDAKKADMVPERMAEHVDTILKAPNADKAKELINQSEQMGSGLFDFLKNIGMKAIDTVKSVATPENLKKGLAAVGKAAEYAKDFSEDPLKFAKEKGHELIMKHAMGGQTGEGWFDDAWDWVKDRASDVGDVVSGVASTVGQLAPLAPLLLA